MSARRTVVIVGANLAGGRAAEALRQEGFDGRIILIGDEPHRPYERPPLSKELLRGEAAPDAAFLRPEEYYTENGIELLLGARATQIDTEGQVVALSEGITLGYDDLLLCTGARPRTLRIPGSDLDGIMTLRTFEDAFAMREQVRAGSRVVVVGMGFIGAEVAASLQQVGAEVTALDVAAVPLERALGAEVGRVIGDIHEDHGIDLRMSVSVERYEGDARARAVVLGDGTTFDADLIVVGVGMAPNDELARAAGITCDDGILVDEHCRTNIPNVYAAGDVARHPNPIVGEQIRIEHWQNAQNQAAAAAKAILGSTDGFAEVPWFWSDQYDVNIQMFGHPSGWDRVVFRGDVDAADFAAFYLRDGRLLASLGLNRQKDARAVRSLIERGSTVDPSVLADEDEDLRAYAKRAVS